MKSVIMVGVVAAAVLLVGCDEKKNSSPESSATLSSLPALQPALAAWSRGDTSTAIADFLAADWGAHPLFAAGSPLSLNDDQMHALRARSETEYHVESKALTTQLAYLKQLAEQVRYAGYDAVSKGDTAQARKCFTSLKQFGTALDRPDHTLMVRMAGREYEDYADAGMAKIRQ